MVDKVITRKSIGLSELKTSPGTVLEESEGDSVAVLSRNKVLYYIVPPSVYEQRFDEHVLKDEAGDRG